MPLYHVTTAENAELIFERGFNPSDQYNTDGSGIYFWNNLKWAENYVWDMWMHRIRGEPRRDPYKIEDPVIIEVAPNAKDRAKIRRFRNPDDSWHEVASIYPLPESSRARWRPEMRLIDASYVLDLPDRPIPDAP